MTSSSPKSGAKSNFKAKDRAPRLICRAYALDNSIASIPDTASSRINTSPRLFATSLPAASSVPSAYALTPDAPLNAEHGRGAIAGTQAVRSIPSAVISDSESSPLVALLPQAKTTSAAA